MYVRDIMTTGVVTISSNTSIIKARKIMEKNKLKRLPVVDDGKLVGMVTAQRLERMAPSETGRSMWELTYSFGSMYRTSVKQIMQTDLVTARPDMTVEEAVALAQYRKVGVLLVVDKGKLVGIVTTNDFFYRIVNKVLGVGEPGCRIEVKGGGDGKAMEEVISAINKQGLEIITVHVLAAHQAKKKDIVVHINHDDVTELFAELEAKGYKVDMRCR
ncbi:CBS domain-containing protein [Chloroflexota bacterium]